MKRIVFHAIWLAGRFVLIGHSAPPVHAARLLFNDLNSSDIRSIDTDGSNLHVVFSTGGFMSTSLAYEPLAAKIYWGVDLGANYIARANLDGSNAETLFFSDGPDALAIDSAAGKIYFGSEDSGTVQRSNFDGTANQTLFTEVGSTPFGVAVNAAHGKVYWTSTDSNRFINRANLDGSNHEDLITGPGPDPGSTFGQPFGIALDVSGGKLYFSDEDDSHFYRANLDGTGLEVFTPNSMMHPHGIALDLAAGRIYWAQEGAIGGSDFDGSNAVLYSVPGYPHNLTLVPEPATWLLLLSGSAVVLVWRFRRGVPHQCGGWDE